jgi:5S rRNA maturation endonuclease (ribonuclease M5)
MGAIMTLPPTYKGKQLIHSWPYLDSEGVTIGIVARYQNDTDKKDIVPFFKPNGTGWKVGIDLTPRPLFGLDKLANHPKEKAVFIVEGEKPAAALQSLGICAVTSLGGGNAANKSDWTPLNGFDNVYLLPDNDEPGESYAKTVCQMLAALPSPPQVKIWRLSDLTKGADIVDWLQNHAPDWDGYQPFPESEKAWVRSVLKQELQKAVPPTDDWLTISNQQSKPPPTSKQDEADISKQIQPDPLRAPLPPAQPYPVDSLGNVLGKAAKALNETIKAPLAVCCQSILASASLAAQGHFDVELPWGEKKPLSLYLLTVAESGERKSGVDDVVLGAAKMQERQDMKKYASKIDAYENDLAQCKAKAEAKNKPNSQTSGISKISSVDNSEPKPVAPLMPLRFVTDPTVEGLYKLLAIGQPNVGLFSDEGGLLIGGHALNNDNALKTMARWCKLWDGSPFDRVRAGDGSGILYGRRMAMHQMAQPDVMTTLLSNRMANGQGFLAQCLVAWPESTIGSRHIESFEWPGNREEVKRLFKELKTLLEAEPKTGTSEQELTPVALTLDQDAKQLAVASANQFETLMQKGSDLSEVKDRAAKALENACRIAGVLAVIENGLATRSIAKEHLVRGLVIVQWYLTEALRIRGAALIPQSVIDAETLSKWLHEREITLFRTAPILTNGPSHLRNKTRLKAAINELVSNGYLAENDPGTEVDGVNARSSWRVLHHVV